jgi:drug/metabolite transporter (DMT)-like permease
MMTDFAVAGRTTAEYVRGALYGLAAVSIWSGWIVVARFGLKTSLTPWDIAALRFSVAGLLLLPYVVNKGLALERLGWLWLAAIVLGGGAPVLLANAGLLFAPAAHAGALFPGVMPLAVALLATFILHEPFTDAKKVGFVLILFGVLGVAWGTGSAIASGQTFGHALFLASLWRGRATRSRCVARGSMGCMPRVLLPSAPSFFTCPSICSWKARALRKPHGAI